MNEEQQKRSRQYIKDEVKKLPESSQIVFKDRYSEIYRNLAMFKIEHPDCTINGPSVDIIVDEIPADKLDHTIIILNKTIAQIIINNAQDNANE